MGYTHYWYRPQTLEARMFAVAVKDIYVMLPVFERFGVPLAGGNGIGHPRITNTEICFNGVEQCGHQETDLGVAWPSNTARGVNEAYQGAQHSLASTWFAGAQVQTRVCGGDCSHEGFYVPRTFEPESYQQPYPDKHNFYFDFCKTAFKPYDLAVTVCLVILKHYLPHQLLVSSDGEEPQWADAKILCQKALGYGADFTLEE